MVTAAALVAPLGAPACDPARFGGKGAALGRLVELGHRVPPGFVVATTALADTLAHLGVGDALDRLDTSMRGPGPDLGAAGAIRDALLADAVPADLKAVLHEHVARMAGTGELIVRSSATVEDSAMHSYAGMFDSIRIAGPESFAAALGAVWASVFAPRALLYAHGAGVTSIPAMAVVVQRFVDATRSGVMFTSFTGSDGGVATLVEHVAGTAERLVAGEVTPERLWLRNGDTGEVPGSLSQSQADRLAALASRLEEQFGGPQDVEWCLDGDDLYVVQSRPVTVGLDHVAAPAIGGDVLVRGTPASPGVGAGVTHLAFNVEQALALQPGRVLVTTMTNPDMVVAMRNSVGIVTDVGGMICHAAIVSRELQLPCIVGTGGATEALGDGKAVTVDGFSGVVLDGILEIEPAAAPAAGAAEMWRAWLGADSGGAVPRVGTVDLLAAMPDGIVEVAYLVDGDLRCDDEGLWRSPRLGDGDTLDALAGAAAAAAGDVRVRLLGNGAMTAPLPVPTGPVATEKSQVVPLTAAIASAVSARAALAPLDTSIELLTDPRNRPGPPLRTRRGPMPDPGHRSRWWDLLPEYGRFHAEHGTASESGDHDWLELRSEIIISPALQSLVQPGLEMVPRVLGFAGCPPMHTKWIRGRYHMRSDTFALTWGHIVRHTWDTAFLDDMLRRVHLSYGALAEVAALFPAGEEQRRAATDAQVVGLVTSWWYRWVEFFALSWFIQAQGELVLFPVIAETVAANLEDLPPPPPGTRWPGLAELVAPTTPVLSGEYMSELEGVRRALDAAGLVSVEEAAAALRGGRAPGLTSVVERHLERWGWMRDRDLLFQPWDTAERVIETALGTAAHPEPPYAANLSRNRLALAFHADLAEAAGRGAALRHGVRFFHDLNVDRENHHVLWLRYSYPLRLLLLEAGRRLWPDRDMAPEMVFFLRVPEILEALRNLPGAPAGELADLAARRRTAYRHESHLERVDPGAVAEEDDYF